MLLRELRPTRPRRDRARALALTAALLPTALSTGCTAIEPVGCLGNPRADCRPPAACQAVTFACGNGAPPSVRVITDARVERPQGLAAGAANGDILLRNDFVTVVIDAIDHPHHIATTGGTIIDMAPTGGTDHIQQIAHVTGILPRDGAHYTRAETFTQADSRNVVVSASVVVRGYIEGDPNISVVTRYELRTCDRGVRVRTEVYNGSARVWTHYLADAYWWGDRGVTAFVPLRGQGFVQPPLDLVEIDDSWREFPWMAGNTHVEQQTSYAAVPCAREMLAGVQNKTISAAGTPRSIVRPGDGLAFERMIMVADGPGLGGAQALAMQAREQVFRESTVQLRGRAVSPEGMPVGGDERRATLLFYEPAPGTNPDDDAGITPWTETVPMLADGSFSVTVPAGRRLRYRVHRLGRPVAAGVDIPAGATDLGNITVPTPPRLAVRVVDEMMRPLDAEIILVPTGDTRRDEVDGSQYGYFAGCSPYLGPPHAASPACNRALARGGETQLFVPSRPGGAPATYWVYAHAGPQYTLDRARVTAGDGQVQTVNLTLRRIPEPLYPAGSLTGDFHVHGGRSFDITFPDRDRVLSFVTAGVQVIAATDHDNVTTYQEAIASLNVGDRVRILSGAETTPQIPYLLLPGSSAPRVIGHFIFWPITFDPTLPNNGMPWDELMEPFQLYDAMATRMPERGVIQMNHPMADAIILRDLGYTRMIGINPEVPLPGREDGTRQGLLYRGRPGGRRNMDWDAQEVMQGTNLLRNLDYRRLWHSLLAQGVMRAGTANSDSHSLREEQLGYPRNVVLAGFDLASFDQTAFNAAVREGRNLGGNGPVVEASIMGADGQRHVPGLTPFQPAPGAQLEVTVRAPPWIPVREVRVIVNGREATGPLRVENLMNPANPLGTDGVVRYTGRFDVAQLMGGRDGFIVVEAGYPLPAAQDVPDEDGVRDGVFDRMDADFDGRFEVPDPNAMGRLVPEVEPPVPGEDDPRFHFHVVTPGGWPMAFTNPFVLDVDGNGWTAPGLPR